MRTRPRPRTRFCFRRRTGSHLRAVRPGVAIKGLMRFGTHLPALVGCVLPVLFFLGLLLQEQLFDVGLGFFGAQRSFSGFLHGSASCIALYCFHFASFACSSSNLVLSAVRRRCSLNPMDSSSCWIAALLTCSQLAVSHGKLLRYRTACSIKSKV